MESTCKFGSIVLYTWSTSYKCLGSYESSYFLVLHLISIAVTPFGQSHDGLCHVKIKTFRKAKSKSVAARMSNKNLGGTKERLIKRVSVVMSRLWGTCFASPKVVPVLAVIEETKGNGNGAMLHRSTNSVSAIAVSFIERGTFDISRFWQESNSKHILCSDRHSTFSVKLQGPSFFKKIQLRSFGRHEWKLHAISYNYEIEINNLGRDTSLPSRNPTLQGHPQKKNLWSWRALHRRFKKKNRPFFSVPWMKLSSS